jgi:hypothetical protein
MVIGDEDGTCLDRGVDPVLKEWRLTAGGAGEPPARRGGAGGSDVWICARDGEERRVRRRRSGWVQADDAAPFLLRPGRQRRLRRMLPAPVADELQLAASERRRDRGPAWSSSSSSWNISSLVRKKWGRGGGERVRRHCAGDGDDGRVTGGAVSAAVAFVWRRRALWQRDFGAPSESGPTAIFSEAC